MSKKKQPILVVHGGAGNLKFRQRHQQGISEALDVGFAALRQELGALEAVVRAVSLMEEKPVFNCGLGAVPSLTGTIEMDAAVMLDDGSSGAVAAIRDVAYPIQVAQKVMELTDHRLLAGDGALDFARKIGFAHRDPLTRERTLLYKRALKKLRQKKRTKYFSKISAIMDEYLMGTVGAIASDHRGRMAVATSTGGILLHLPGRVGDSPIIGAGTFASQSGGASITGHGEAIMKELVAYQVVKRMKRMKAPEAARYSMDQLTQHKCSCGLICLDKRGEIGIAFNTPAMSYGYIQRDEKYVFEMQEARCTTDVEA
ncbi:isoaspartyl peptidase/L-asparaginase family protein [candidate division CSSED10-310 bacterium]|uniref:Isoaspartyl peptidase/L-asparaginase family protein n=1 Tax=candidate division CSSED10-310 bacterium TaxID=2855610 RepID=A0ABV6YZ88_UNCC1